LAARTVDLWVYDLAVSLVCKRVVGTAGRLDGAMVVE